MYGRQMLESQVLGGQVLGGQALGGHLGQQLVLALIGASAGGVIAAGVFAFLAIIGVFPRLIGKTGTSRHILLYETMIVLGGIIGNVLDLYEFPVLMGQGSNLVLGMFGLSVGVFVGCLVMSLAETLQSLPVINRRIHLAVGFQYVILAIAAGKLAGALVYFAREMSSQ
ncbi:MAG: stage V sporulation protein AB [Eubacteriales bacterium]|nr:stage V sporulation protein AB [Eubacteriales bacterium]